MNLNSMNLQDFITETLFQISEGVKNAKHKIEDTQLQINPYLTERLDGMSSNSDFIGIGEGKKLIQIVNFDISVTAEEDTEKGGDVKIASSVINIGIFGRKKHIEQNVSKIKFSIPISFPVSSGR